MRQASKIQYLLLRNTGETVCTYCIDFNKLNLEFIQLIRHHKEVKKNENLCRFLCGAFSFL
jgi:hypothetical protein